MRRESVFQKNSARGGGFTMYQYLAFSFILLIATTAQAQVYRWEDKDGTVHFASKPQDATAKMATLPKITRAEVKIANPRGVTCDKHGGINCQSGADTDGSVICFDGFKDAVARHRFSCNAAKLEIATISDKDPAGAYTVVVRNSKSVAATDVVITLRGADHKKRSLSGPREIDPFGSAEYVVSQEGDNDLSKPELSALELKCTNCS